MNIYAKDFRRLLRLSVVSLSVASINGLTTNAEAQQVATGYADAIVLPKYYPGMGRVMVLGGIESARSSITSETVSHTQTARPSSGDNKLTVQANVTPDQPNQVKVVVVQQPSTGSSVIPAPTDSPQTPPQNRGPLRAFGVRPDSPSTSQVFRTAGS